VESGQLVVGVPARVVPGHARDGVASQQPTQSISGGEEGA
jgi:hypothetical protein